MSCWVRERIGPILISILDETRGSYKASYIYTMWRRVTAVLLLLLSLSAISWAIDGTFQGRVIDPPWGQPLVQGWIFVQGRNHMLRRVEISHAKVVFSESVPIIEHRKCGMECITAGQEIRVTAEQDGSGEWRAKRVEILKLTTRRI